jgi:hypothetical protein
MGGIFSKAFSSRAPDQSRSGGGKRGLGVGGGVEEWRDGLRN